MFLLGTAQVSLTIGYIGAVGRLDCSQEEFVANGNIAILIRFDSEFFFKGVSDCCKSVVSMVDRKFLICRTQKISKGEGKQSAC